MGHGVGRRRDRSDQGQWLECIGGKLHKEDVCRWYSSRRGQETGQAGSGDAYKLRAGYRSNRGGIALFRIDAWRRDSPAWGLGG